MTENEPSLDCVYKQYFGLFNQRLVARECTVSSILQLIV